MRFMLPCHTVRPDLFRVLGETMSEDLIWAKPISKKELMKEWQQMIDDGRIEIWKVKKR